MSGEGDEVILRLKRALRDSPRSVRTLNALAAGLLARGDPSGAELYARKALAVCAWEPEALNLLGSLLQLQGRYDEAVAVADAALAVRPASGAAWMIRGDAHFNAGDPQTAAAAWESAARDPDAAFDAQVRLAKAARALGRVDDALAALDRAATLRPDSAIPVYERGLLRLENRDFAAGWPDYESRWGVERFIEGSRGLIPRAMVPLLKAAPTAADLAVRRVLLVGEQGIGDQLMFASMIPDLTRIAAGVTCVCEPRLLRLLSASFPDVAFLDPGAGVDSDAIDVLLAMGSLGCAFRRGAELFPGAAYARPRRQVLEAWDARLGPRNGRLRVGLSWRGGVAATRRSSRSVDLAAFQPILDLPDCQFVSLQYGDVQAEIDAVNAGRGNPVGSFPPAEQNDFEDIAALVANLDMVVSVQTAAVHVCGAVGTPCLALIPDNPEWRYMRQGADMPWYGSVRLIRQAAPGEWSSVIATAAQGVATARPTS